MDCGVPPHRRSHHVGCKKSWSELKVTVNELRKELSNLSSMIPMNISFRTLSDGRVRIYFLSTPPNGWETTLLYADVHPTDAPQSKRLQWNLVLEQSIPSISANNAYSREVQLLLERKRLSTWGITSYEMHKPSGRIVFPLSSSLYQCLDTGYNSGPLFPSQLRICPHWAALDPQICPQNSDLIAYVSGGDIWVTHTFTGQDERLTFAHDGRRSFADDPLSAGVPSYVMQEEFSRYQGYWWQPESEGKIGYSTLEVLLRELIKLSSVNSNPSRHTLIRNLILNIRQCLVYVNKYRIYLIISFYTSMKLKIH